MLDQPDWAYHLARNTQCRRMALLASDDAIRKLHEALADGHARKARSAFLFEESGFSRADEFLSA